MQTSLIEAIVCKQLSYQVALEIYGLKNIGLYMQAIKSLSF